MEENELLKVRDLTISFPTVSGMHTVLDHISFDVKKGEIVGIVGESGSGKSMTSLAVMDLLPDHAVVDPGSSISLQGRQMLGMSEEELRQIKGNEISMVFQEPMTSLNPVMKIGRQVGEPLRLHTDLSEEEINARVIDELGQVGLVGAEKLVEQYPHEFSGGMKQRAIIAMALCCEAEILIADEPTTALDVTIQAQIMNLLNTIKKESNTSIILITHDLGVVYENADRISVMYAGRIVENAPVKEFLQTPNHPYSTALLKALPSDTSDKLETIDGQPPTIQQDISGCRFHPRCKDCMDICKNEIPALKLVGDKHFSACWLLPVSKAALHISSQYAVIPSALIIAQ